jgi:uncharacterized damage-inducible protein DinB
MGLKEGLLAELKHEAVATKKILEKVPAASNSWKPHEKSMALGRLATHIAQTPQWASRIITADEFDFAANSFRSDVAETNEALLELHQQVLDKAVADLSAAKDEDFDKIWTVKSGDKVYFQLPKKVAIRGWAYNHMVHHRGQLSVYLRLLGIPVPGMYGPSADEQM